MKKTFATLISFFCFFLFGQTQDVQKFVGLWEGKLNVGIELRIVFHIKADDKGGLISTADSPDQQAYGLVCNATTVKENEITIDMESLNAKYVGKLIDSITISGTFTQVADVPLQLKKVEKISAAKKRSRPQTPQPPFPYLSDSVEYDNADKTVHLGATLTYPSGKGPFPAVILISGSGQQDRDETIAGHKPFAVIADYLTKKGFAVLRVDDRGQGKSKGEVVKATSEDFAKDVMTSMDYLKTRKEIAKNKIGLMGHSEGGLIASIVLTLRKDIAFIISLSGTGMKGADILADQGEVIMRKEGLDSAAARAYNILYRKIIQHSIDEKDPAACMDKVMADYNEWKATLNPQQLKELGMENEDLVKRTFTSLITELQQPWLQFFNKSNAALNYESAYCPVLALNGAEDIQVIADKNLNGIKQALQKSKSKNYEVKALAGLNHLYQHCVKCSLSEYGELEETFAPEALEIMSNWLEKIVRN